ncbi:MAG: hypothetical protein U5O39_15140 [Gammaproteobacteria bacterium]|nr:hypothetical protein [Gammaproteobacteria bacterium]
MPEPTEAWLRALRIILCFLAILWVFETINTVLGHRLNVLGIYPREIETLPGIVLWPFLHANFQHLIVNTTPLAMLGFFVALRGWVVFVQSQPAHSRAWRPGGVAIRAASFPHWRERARVRLLWLSGDDRNL